MFNLTSKQMNKTLIVLSLVFVFTCNTYCQYSVELDGWDGSFSRFEWYTMNDQLVGTVVYNRENLNIGWIAVGISDYEGWGMGNADILLVWKQGDTYRSSFRHSYASGLPQIVPEANFESFSVQEINQKVELQFVKRLSYTNIANSVNISNRNMAIMAAYNERETPADLNNFAKHNWATKRYINFFTNILVERSKEAVPQESDTNTVDMSQVSLSIDSHYQSLSEHLPVSEITSESVLDESGAQISKSDLIPSIDHVASATTSALWVLVGLISIILQLFYLLINR